MIHSGAFYDGAPLKTALCLRGRPLLYEFCKSRGVAHRKCGKLVVATSPVQAEALRRLCSKGSSLDPPVPLHLLSGDQARELEPELHPDVALAVHSPETGILDTHGLIAKLEEEILEQDTGSVLVGTRVLRLDRDAKAGGWVVQTASGGGDPHSFLARVVVNAAGLRYGCYSTPGRQLKDDHSAHHLFNEAQPDGERRKLWYCKGNYFKYRGPGAAVSRLIYPAPAPDLAGLGTHLTMDLGGNIRFGPDVEWLKAPDLEAADWWMARLEPPDSPTQVDKVYQAVASYLPAVSRSGFTPDYAGIRPKLKGPGQGPSDFSISQDAPGFVNLMGVESPGLTACLAIGQQVEGLIRHDIWGMGQAQSRTSNLGAGPEAWA